MGYHGDLFQCFLVHFLHDILSQHKNINYSSDLVVFIPNIKSFSLRPTAVSHTYFHCSARIQSYKATDINLCWASIIITLHPMCPADSMNASLTLMVIQARSLPTFHLPDPVVSQQDALLFLFFISFFFSFLSMTVLQLQMYPSLDPILSVRNLSTQYVFFTRFVMDRCHLLLN